MALNNLDRFVGRGPQSAVAGHALRARSARRCRSLLQIFVHQPAPERPAGHRPRELRPAAADRGAAGGPRRRWSTSWRPRSRPWTTTRRPCCGAAALQTPRDAAHRLRRHRPRAARCDTVTAQISYLADAIVEARRARRAAQARAAARHAARPDGQPARFVVLGMGKLGGIELNYSSDIDLIFLYDADGRDRRRRGRSTTASSSTGWPAKCVRLLTEPTELGSAYRVDLRLRPDGQRGPMVVSLRGGPALLRRARAAPGSGRPTSRPGPSPATSTWAASSSSSSRPGSIAAT